MASINQCTLLGNVGKDPEVKTLQNGNKVVNFSVATSEQWRDKNSGERKEKTDWHNVVVFGNANSDGLAGVAEKFIKKGSRVYVQGAIKTRQWEDQSGQKRYSTEIVLSGFDAKLILLGDKDNAGGGRSAASSPDEYGSSSSQRSSISSGASADSRQTTGGRSLHEDVLRIKQMYAAGVTTKRMCLELDRAPGSLLAKIHRLGIADRRRKATANIHFSITKEERSKLAMRAMAQGKTLSGYLRAVVRRDLAA